MIIEIPMEEYRNRNKTCHYCDTWVSVKYKIHTDELDRVYHGMNGYVYCCKKCAKRHYIGDKN